jgi:hypothetical protein
VLSLLEGLTYVSGTDPRWGGIAPHHTPLRKQFLEKTSQRLRGTQWHDPWTRNTGSPLNMLAFLRCPRLRYQPHRTDPSAIGVRISAQERTAMPRILHCDCGHQLTLSDAEMGELTWCPRCRKVLVRPSLYQRTERNVTTPLPVDFPATLSHLRLMALVVVGSLAVVAFFLGLIGRSLDGTRHQVPSYEPSRFHRQPSQPLLDDPPPPPFDFDRGLLPNPAGQPKLNDPLAPFRPGVDVFPGVRPGGPERRPDDP